MRGDGRDLPVSRGLVIPAAEIRELASRSGGPGGQHVNKTSTRVTLRWDLARSRVLGDRQRARLLDRLASRLTREGVLVVHAARSRSRARNRELARERIAELVGVALRRARPRRPTRPTGASRERRLEGKKHRSRIKAGRGSVPEGSGS
jgi:ribosome-associated protein